MRSQERLRERNGVDSSGDGLAVVRKPSISGTAQVGQTLTGTNAQYAGTATITITRAWLRDGSAISGATGATYVLQPADEGAVISLQNSATNQYGVLVSRSDPTATVIAA